MHRASDAAHTAYNAARCCHCDDCKLGTTATRCAHHILRSMTARRGRSHDNYCTAPGFSAPGLLPRVYSYNRRSYVILVNSRTTINGSDVEVVRCWSNSESRSRRPRATIAGGPVPWGVDPHSCFERSRHEYHVDETSSGSVRCPVPFEPRPARRSCQGTIWCSFELGLNEARCTRDSYDHGIAANHFIQISVPYHQASTIGGSTVVTFSYSSIRGTSGVDVSFLCGAFGGV